MKKAIVYLTLFLTLCLCLSTSSSAAEPGSVWDAIAALEAERLPDGGGEADYAALCPAVEALVTAREDYVPGTLYYQDDILCWRTTDGLPNGYCPSLRSEQAAEARMAAEAEPLSEAELAEVRQVFAEADAELMGIGENTYYDAAFFSPHFNELVWKYRFNLTGFYKIQEIANYTHGNYEAYFNDDATIDNLASAIQHCCVVAINSHGSRGGYVELSTMEGITETDKAYDGNCTGGHYDHVLYSGDDVLVDGVCIVNHMTGPAAGGLVYLGCCWGMQTNSMEATLREAGVGVVVGFSRNVHHRFDDIVTEEFLDAIADGLTVSKASQRLRERLVDRTGLAAQSVVYWDPWMKHVGDLISTTPGEARDHDTAFIVITSDEDPFPADTQTKQPVYSTWELPWREGQWTQDIEIVAPVGTSFQKYFGNAWVKKMDGIATLLHPEEIPPTVQILARHVNDGGHELYYSALVGYFDTPGYWESEVELTTGDGVRETRRVRLMAYSDEPSRTEEYSTIHELGRSITWGVLGAPPFSARLLSGKLPEGTWMSDRGLVVGYPQETGVFKSSWRVITWSGETCDLKLTLTVRGEARYYNQTVNEKEGVPLSLSLETGDDSGVYHMELIDGALPPGVSMGSSQSEEPYIRGSCDTPGDYTAKLRIVTVQFQTVVHTVSFHIYREFHELDYLRLDLTKGPAYLPDNLYERVWTSLSYAARSGQITANNIFYDLDKDGHLDVRLNGNSHSVELLSSHSLTDDFYVLEMNEDTRKLLNDAGLTYQWYESLNFWLVENYFLLIDGTQVTSRNRTDVLKNGVFSFDGLNTLTVRGDYAGKTAEPLIESDYPGLTIRVEESSTLTAKDTGILAHGVTTVTGPGLLDLKAGGAGILCTQQFSGKPDLSITDATLRIVAGTSALLCGDKSGKCALTIIHSDLNLKGGSSAAEGFETITLRKDIVSSPLRGDAVSGALRDLSGTVVKEATISTYEEAYDLVIDGMQVTDRNKNNVLSNGVFAYDDKNNTLYIRKSYTGSDENRDVLIDSHIPGLNIVAASDVTLTGKGIYTLRLGGDTLLLGSSLTLKNDCGTSGAAICLVDAASLTVDDAALKLQSGGYGIYAKDTGRGKCAAHIVHSDVVIEAAASCVRFYGSFDWTDCDLTGGLMHSSGGWFELDDAENTAVPATHVTFDRNRHYKLWIEGTQVGDNNCADVLGDGTFAYDADTQKLTVKRDHASASSMLWSEVQGLTVYVESDLKLENDDMMVGTLLSFAGDTTIRGPGKLTLASPRDCLMVTDGAQLRIETPLDARSEMYGGVRGANGGEKLIVNGAALYASGDRGGVTGFSGGIELTGCALLDGCAVRDGDVVDSAGSTASTVRIGLVDLPNDLNGDGRADADDASWLVMHLLFGAEKYPLGDVSCDFDGSGKVDLNDAAHYLFRIAFDDPSHQPATFIAAGYDISGRMTGVRIIRAADVLSGGELDFLKSAKLIRFFCLDGSGAPMMKSKTY